MGAPNITHYWRPPRISFLVSQYSHSGNSKVLKYLSHWRLTARSHFDRCEGGLRSASTTEKPNTRLAGIYQQAVSNILKLVNICVVHLASEQVSDEGSFPRAKCSKLRVLNFHSRTAFPQQLPKGTYPDINESCYVCDGWREIDSQHFAVLFPRMPSWAAMGRPACLIHAVLACTGQVYLPDEKVYT